MFASHFSCWFSPAPKALGREPIDPHCRVAHDRIAMTRVGFRGVEIGRDEIAIAGPQLLDRKIRAEQAAIGSEDINRFGNDSGDMGGIVAMDERAEPGEL